MMENLNNGGIVYDFDLIRENGIETSAGQFAEGSEPLKRVLLKLWDMGIFTFASCKGRSEQGHRTGILKQPYVSILVDEKSKEAAFALVEAILASSEKNKPNVTVFSDLFVGDGKYRTSVLLDRLVLTNAACDRMFESLERILERHAVGEHSVLPAKTEKALEEAKKLFDVAPLLPCRRVSVSLDHKNGAVSFAKGVGDKMPKKKVGSIEKLEKAIEEHTTEPRIFEHVEMEGSFKPVEEKKENRPVEVVQKPASPSVTRDRQI